MTVTSLQCQEVQVIKWRVVLLQHFIISSFNKYSMTTWYALSCILTFIIDHFISNLEMQCPPHRKSSSNLSTQILYPCPQQSWIMSRDILNLLYNMSSHSVVSLFRFITCMPLRALTARDEQLCLISHESIPNFYVHQSLCNRMPIAWTETSKHHLTEASG